MRDDDTRKVLEEFYGRELTDEQWAGYKPGRDETLDEVASALPPRMREREWELAASIEISSINASVALIVNGIAEAARAIIFDQPHPPFSTLQEAHAWIRQQQVSKDCRNQAGEGAVAEKYWAFAHCRLGERSRLMELVQEMYEANHPWLKMFKLEFREVWLPPIETGAPNGEQRTVGKRLYRLPDATESILREDEGSYLANTDQLIQLSRFAELAARLSGCWSLGEVTAYILTGIVPQLPRLRVWTRQLSPLITGDDLPVGQQAFIELNGAFNYREMRELHAILREKAGLKRKKSLTPEDVQIIEFVEATPYLKWQGRRAKWNTENPERSFARPAGLQMAYNRARDRLSRP